MGIIIAPGGTILLIPVIMVLALFAGNIMFLDSILMAVIGAALLYSATGMHAVFCILTAILILAAMTVLYVRQWTFRIFTALFTLTWGYVCGFMIHDLTGDPLWSGFIGIITATAVFLLHLYTKAQIISRCS